MDLFTASAFVHVAAENASHYSVAIQRNLLEGIFQLADESKEGLCQRSDAGAYEGVQTSLSLAKLFISDALKHGDLAEGFRLAAECFAQADAVPQEIA